MVVMRVYTFSCLCTTPATFSINGQCSFIYLNAYFAKQQGPSNHDSDPVWSGWQ